MKKRTYRWQVEMEDGRHEIVFETGLIQSCIWVDQSPPKHYSRIPKRWDAFSLELGGHQIEINTYNSLLSGHNVSLTLDDEWIPGTHEMHPNQLPEAEIFHLRHRIFLERLARQMHLQHIVLNSDGSLLDGVVVGVVNDFLCIIQVAQSHDDIPYHRVCVRYKEVKDAVALKKEINKAFVKVPFFRNTSILYRPYVGDTLITFGCFLNPRQAFMDEIQNYMETVTLILKKYALPTDPNRCEKENCQSKAEEKPSLVLIEKFPLRWCPACVRDFCEQLEKDRLAYQQSPSRFREGLATSLLTWLIAGLIVSVSMNIGAGAAVGISIVVVPLAAFVLPLFLEHSGIKLTRRLFSVSAASIGGISPLGIYLALAWRIQQNPALLNYKGILFHPWSYLGKEWGIPWFVAIWSLMMVVLLQHKIWTRRTELLESQYNPQTFVASKDDDVEA